MPEKQQALRFNKIITILVKFDDNELKLDDGGKLNLTLPYSLSERRTAIYKSTNETETYSHVGQCKEVNA